MIKRNANAVWNGSVKEGNGQLTTESSVLEHTPYSFKTRFADEKGTNPDELLAASHAGCYAMALSLILGEAGFKPDSLDVKATVSMDADQLKLTESHLTLKAKIPNIDQAKFEECANEAKMNCPISKALSLNISLDAELIQAGETVNN